MDVALFITCLTDTFYPRAGIAVVKVLEHLGCRVQFPDAQTCCGQPMWNSGYHADAKKLAQRMIEVFESSERVVTPSGSCCSMIREYYAPMFADDPAWSKRAAGLVDKTYEFAEFLTKVLHVDFKDLGVKWERQVTFHYACHSRGIGMPPELVPGILQQIEGIDFVPLEEADQCCGFGGMFAVKFPVVSGGMVRQKVACIAKTKAPVAVCNEGGCTMNIAGACQRENVDVKLISLAEIIAEGLGLMEPSA
jgi:L-lactate dehydrogenase complex protein LldE